MLAPKIKVGVISYPTSRYNYQKCWIASEEMLSVISKVVAYLHVLDFKINLEARCQAHILHCRLGLGIGYLFEVSQIFIRQGFDSNDSPVAEIVSVILCHYGEVLDLGFQHRGTNVLPMKIGQYLLFRPRQPKLSLIPMRG